MDLKNATPSQAVEFALYTLLEKGFSSSYYDSWKEFVEGEYGEEIEVEDEGYVYTLTEYQGTWEAMLQEVPIGKTFHFDGIDVTWLATEQSGIAVARDDYFVVFSLSDGETVRYVKHSGYYSSYSGGQLHEGASSDVFPQEKTVTVWMGK